NGELITGATLLLQSGSSLHIRKEMKEILRSRSRKFPRKLPNCGSVFVSDPEMYKEHGPPGSIIEKLGFKGRMRGGAVVSPLHANFIVNTGRASSNDVLMLIREISRTAQRDLGAPLRAEVRYIAPDGKSFAATDVPEERLGQKA
ncbi:UDP-N-acetylenolpyruvoylglucosamine reductase, partial [Pseudidiomarina aestuarii]